MLVFPYLKKGRMVLFLYLFIIIIYLFDNLFIFDYYFGCAGTLHFSLFVASGYYSLAAVPRFPTAVASLVAEHGLRAHQPQQLWNRFSCSAACGAFQDQESDQCFLHFKVDS